MHNKSSQYSLSHHIHLEKCQCIVHGTKHCRYHNISTNHMYHIYSKQHMCYFHFHFKGVAHPYVSSSLSLFCSSLLLLYLILFSLIFTFLLLFSCNMFLLHPLLFSFIFKFLFFCNMPILHLVFHLLNCFITRNV